MDSRINNEENMLNSYQNVYRKRILEKKEFISKLPVLKEEDLLSLGEKDSCCPICFNSFLAILASEEMALAMDSPAVATEDLGLTRLMCGHIFCRKDISAWITMENTCPTCRRPFIQAGESSERDDLEEIVEREYHRLEDLLGISELGLNVIGDDAERIPHAVLQHTPRSSTQDEHIGLYS